MAYHSDGNGPSSRAGSPAREGRSRRPAAPDPRSVRHRLPGSAPAPGESDRRSGERSPVGGVSRERRYRGLSSTAGTDLLAQEKHGGWEPLHAPGGNRPADPGPMGAAPAQADLGPRARKGDEEGLRETLRTAIGGGEATFVDPLGNRVNVNQSIVDHILEVPRRHDGREQYFPFIPEAIESPGEIWVGFPTSRETGRVWVRRRYISLVSTPKSRIIGLVADLDGGRWAGLTFFPSRTPAGLRTGLRIYAAE